MPRLRSVALLLSILLLAGCGKDDGTSATRGPDGTADAALPAPSGAVGSVTGMPDRPGPGPVGEQGVALPQPDVALDENGTPLPPEDGPADGGTLANAAEDTATDVPGEPTANDAVAVMRDYFAAVNSGNFARAYALWADGGRASGQSPQGFADGFADTTGLSVELMAPGRVEAAAGSRFVEVPVNLRATLRDGSERRMTGAFTLRRAVVDGATAEQRAWRIATADLRDVP